MTGERGKGEKRNEICKCYFLNNSTKKGGTFPQYSNFFIKEHLDSKNADRVTGKTLGSKNWANKSKLKSKKSQGQSYKAKQEETAGRMTRQSGAEGRGSTASQQDPGGTDYKAGRLNTKHSSQ